MKQRSSQKELLDLENIERDELYRNLYELDIINRRLGGYDASRKALSRLLDLKDIQCILDIGSGGGGFVKQLGKYAERKKKKIFFYGVDVRKDCIDYAEWVNSATRDKKFICKDYRELDESFFKKTDALHCSLFLHHLSNEEIVQLFALARKYNCAVIANDLHRHWFAYHSIRVLTALFSGNRLVKNDAPLSVKRGFKREELVSLLREAGFESVSVKWSWAFRYSIVAI